MLAFLVSIRKTKEPPSFTGLESVRTDRRGQAGKNRRVSQILKGQVFAFASASVSA